MEPGMDELPARIPVLPYKNRVLLPGGIIRVVCTSPSSMRLVETQMWQKKGPCLVGLVPAMDAPTKATASPPTNGTTGTPPEGTKRNLQGTNSGGMPPGNAEGRMEKGRMGSEELAGGAVGEEEEGEGRVEGEEREGREGVGLGQWLGVAASKFEPLDFQHGLGGQIFFEDDLQWHKRGVLARALHVGKRSGGKSRTAPYTLVLEGFVRFEIVQLNSRGPFRMADVNYLWEGHPADANQIRHIQHLEGQLLGLGRELASTSGKDVHPQALSFLSQTMDQPDSAQSPQHSARQDAINSHNLRNARGSISNHSVGMMGSSEGGGYLADVLVSCFEPEFAPRLLVLDSINPVTRLSVAIDILNAQLMKQTCEKRKMTAAQEEEEGQAQEPKQPTDARESKPHDLFMLPEGRKQGSGTGPLSSSGSRTSRGMKFPPIGGNEEDDEDDVGALKKRIAAAGLPEAVLNQVKRDIRRLQKMQPQQPGYNTAFQHLELIADLPWATPPKSVSKSGAHALTIDVGAAKEQLDQEHFGLEKVKQRIVEYIAVRKLKPDAMGPVLCFVGPPGVGKTSLAASIASALGRKFVRIALGGVKDEADIRGHRRTYVGSMPGRIIEGIKRVGVNNPVMLLDELDKTGTDARGDPASALLEVLDPQQNKSFTDHYVGLPFDLSGVVFLATANRTRPMPAPLLDRMEIIEIPGYTPEEKKRIAMRHLLPRILDQHGLTNRQLIIQPHIVELMIQRYTREAGVRALSRNLAALARAAAVQVAQSQRAAGVARAVSTNGHEAEEEGSGSGMVMEMEMGVDALGLKAKEIAEAMVEMEPILVTEQMMESILGPSKFDGNEVATRVATPGVAVGLVWTAVGGEVQFVEASIMAGKGELHLTGQLGDVIKESAQIALTWVRSHAVDLLSAEGQGTKHASGGVSLPEGEEHLANSLPSLSMNSPSYGGAPSVHLNTSGGAATNMEFSGDTSSSSSNNSSNNNNNSSSCRGIRLGDGESLEVDGGDVAMERELLSPRKRSTVRRRGFTGGGGEGRWGSGGEGRGGGGGDFMARQDVHIHFPAGAVPKDGPSAGVTLVTALVSLLTQRCVRADTAMTGEVTLQGLVLPVGGIKEKILAAHRCGIRRVILPHLNLKEVLSEVPAETLACMEILPAKRVGEVLREVFDGGIPMLPRSRM